MAQQTLVFTATVTTQVLVFLAEPASGNNSLRIDLGPDGVTLTAIPIPAAGWLFAGGLMALLGRFRRRR